MRADAVAQEFGFEYDTYPITPADAERIKVKDVTPMEVTGNYDEYAGEKVTGPLAPADASSNAFSITAITKSLLLIVIVYLLL